MSEVVKEREKRSLYAKVATIHGCRQDFVKKVANGKRKSAAVMETLVYLRQKEQEAYQELQKILADRKALKDQNVGEITQIQKAS